MFFSMKEKCELNIVAYKTLAGQSFPIGSLGDSDLRLRVQNTTEDECREYAAALENLGYRRCAAKEIPAGTEYAYNTNLFYTYQNENSNVFIFWVATMRTVFITVEPLGGIPSVQVAQSCDEKKVAPTFTQFRLPNGMGFATQLQNGEFILVDGGIKDTETSEQLYAFLKEKAVDGKPNIALWIFTHCHKDHIGLPTEFLTTYQGKVSVQAFAYQFPNCDKVEVAMESVADRKQAIADLETIIQDGYPNAVVYTLHTGQSYFYAGVEIEILYSLDDTYPYPYLSFNDMSVAFRMRFENGQTILLLGDSQNMACKAMADRYGDYLKSDFLQVAHHGLIGGDKRLYQMIDPEVCFWATTETRFLGKKPNQRYQWCIGEGGCDYNAYLRDENIRRRTHYHGSKTTTIKV